MFVEPDNQLRGNKTGGYIPVNNVGGLLLDQLQDTAALSGMFDEMPALQTRQEQRLLPYDTTDAQAEVLVFDTM
ncbi:hypothetical protein U9U05_004673 [Salmonella enterica]|nr:hypothetical protein [Salmonella enterica]EMB8653278.1 hypothetical protein [Salmonella enterica]